MENTFIKAQIGDARAQKDCFGFGNFCCFYLAEIKKCN